MDVLIIIVNSQDGGREYLCSVVKHFFHIRGILGSNLSSQIVYTVTEIVFILALFLYRKMLGCAVNLCQGIFLPYPIKVYGLFDIFIMLDYW
jgi:hypothetical protein